MRNPANKPTNKQTDTRSWLQYPAFRGTKILATQRFELSTLAFLAERSFCLSYRAVLIWILLSDYYYTPYSRNFIQIRPVVHEKELSGFQIRISIRITPNFELNLPMIFTSLLIKLLQNPTTSSWEIVLETKQTNKRTNKKIFSSQKSELSTIAFPAQSSYRLSYRAVLICLLLSDYYFSPYLPNFIKIRPIVHEKQLSGSQIRISIRITPNFKLDLPMIFTSLLTKFHQNPTSRLWEILPTNQQTNKQTHEVDCNIPLFAGQKFWPHRGSNSRPSRFQHNTLTDWAIGPYFSAYYYQNNIIVPSYQISSKSDQ